MAPQDSAARFPGAAALHLTALLLAPWGLVGCASDTADAAARDADAGVPDAGGDANAAPPFAIMGPAAPSAPQQAPCADGWVEAEDDGIVHCLPWAEGTPAACAGASFQPPGEESCSDVGNPCPVGDFPEDIVGTEVVYVQPDATGGDGSRARPFASLDEVSGVPPGSVVVLSKGIHQTQYQIPRGVRLRGTCTTETILTRSGTGGLLLGVGAVGSAISDLTIADAPGIAIVAFGGGEVTVERVVVERGHHAALRARTGSTLIARDVLVRDTAGRMDTGNNGMALIAEDASTVTIERAVFEESRQLGVLASGEGTRVSLDRVAILRTLGQDSDGAQGAALVSQDGALLEARRTAILETRFIGIAAIGATLECDQCYIAKTRPQLSGDAQGEAVVAFSGGTLVLTRSVVTEVQTRGVWAGFEGSSITVEDSLIRDVLPQDGDRQGRGLHAFMGGHILARRVAVHRTIGHAVSATSASAIDAEDLIIEGVVPRAIDGKFGRAISAVDGSRVTIARVSVTAHVDSAAMAATGATLTVTDLTVGPAAVENVDQGRVLQVQEGATGSFERVSATGWRYAGLTCVAGATCSLTDAAFRDGNRSIATWTRGVHVLDESTLEARRVEFSGLTGMGLYASHGGVADIHDLRILDIAPCEQDCIYPGGSGIAVFLGGVVTLDGFTVDGASLCGLHLAQTASVDLRNGTISGSAIGICLQTDAYDLERLQSGVTFVDNMTNLDSVTLAVPDPPRPVGSGE